MSNIHPSLLECHLQDFWRYFGKFQQSIVPHTFHVDIMFQSMVATSAHPATWISSELICECTQLKCKKARFPWDRFVQAFE